MLQWSCGPGPAVCAQLYTVSPSVSSNVHNCTSQLCSNVLLCAQFKPATGRNHREGLPRKAGHREFFTPHWIIVSYYCTVQYIPCFCFFPHNSLDTAKQWYTAGYHRCMAQVICVHQGKCDGDENDDEDDLRVLAIGLSWRCAARPSYIRLWCATDPLLRCYCIRLTLPEI